MGLSLDYVATPSVSHTETYDQFPAIFRPIIDVIEVVSSMSIEPQSFVEGSLRNQQFLQPSVYCVRLKPARLFLRESAAFVAPYVSWHFCVFVQLSPKLPSIQVSFRVTPIFYTHLAFLPYIISYSSHPIFLHAGNQTLSTKPCNLHS